MATSRLDKIRDIFKTREAKARKAIEKIAQDGRISDDELARLLEQASIMGTSQSGLEELVRLAHEREQVEAKLTDPGERDKQAAKVAKALRDHDAETEKLIAKRQAKHDELTRELQTISHSGDMDLRYRRELAELDQRFDDLVGREGDSNFDAFRLWNGSDDPFGDDNMPLLVVSQDVYTREVSRRARLLEADARQRWDTYTTDLRRWTSEDWNTKLANWQFAADEARQYGAAAPPKPKARTRPEAPARRTWAELVAETGRIAELEKIIEREDEQATAKLAERDAEREYMSR